MLPITHLTDLFVELADTLVDHYDSIDFLHRLTDHAAAISGAEAVGLMLTDSEGHLQYFASSNDTGRMLELFQLQVQEGPCVDCFNTRTPVVNADLAAAVDRWPRFAPAATAAGFVAVHAFPMRLRQNAIGALNLFSHTSAGLAPDLVRLVQAMADIATISILQERNLSRAEALSEQLQSAFDSRVVIEQAKGVVAHQERITPDEAFTRLRDRARSSRRKLADVAAEVLAGLDGHA